MKKEFLYVLISLFIILNVNATFATRKVDSEITVTGLVFREYFYEQPHYGDSPKIDSIGSACMLKLDKEIEADEKSIEKIHLVFPRKMVNCNTVIGHRIEISGTVAEAENEHIHGDARVDVNSYRIIR